MLKKSRALALAVTTAGLIGVSASVASAATMAPGWQHSGPGSSVVNVSGNQVPVQACGNDAGVNGAGSQVVGEGSAVVGSLLSPGSVTMTKAKDNRGCNMANKLGSSSDSARSSVVNIANNQVPVQACGNDIFGNAGGSQVPLEGDAAVLTLLSPGAITGTSSSVNRGCNMLNAQGW